MGGLRIGVFGVLLLEQRPGAVIEEPAGDVGVLGQAAGAITTALAFAVFAEGVNHAVLGVGVDDAQGPEPCVLRGGWQGSVELGRHREVADEAGGIALADLAVVLGVSLLQIGATAVGGVHPVDQGFVVDKVLGRGLDLITGAGLAELIQAVFAQGAIELIPAVEEHLRALQGLQPLCGRHRHQRVGAADAGAGVEEVVEQFNEADHQTADDHAGQRAERPADGGTRHDGRQAAAQAHSAAHDGLGVAPLDGVHQARNAHAHGHHAQADGQLARHAADLAQGCDGLAGGTQQ